MTPEDAELFKRKIVEGVNGPSLPPDVTLEKFFAFWMPVYGKEHWSPKTFEQNMSLLRNHILPELCHKEMYSLTTYEPNALTS